MENLLLRKPFRFLYMLVLFVVLIYGAYGCGSFYEGSNVLIQRFRGTQLISAQAVVDKKVVYLETDGSGFHYFCFDMKNGTREEIGTVSNCVIAGRGVVLPDQCFYIYNAIVQEDGSNTNSLIKIDPNQLSLSVLSSDELCTPMITLSPCKYGLLAVKASASGSGKTWIELISPEYGTVIFTLFPDENETFVAASSDEESIYALSFSGNGNNARFLLKEYDLDTLSHVSVYSLDSIQNELLTARIGAICVRGRCLFLENYSNLGMIIDLGTGEQNGDNNDSPTILKSALKLTMARDIQPQQGDEMVLFIHGTDECIILQPDNGSMLSFDLELKPGYQIRSIYTDGDHIFVSTRKPNNVFKQKYYNDYLYLYEYEDFVKLAQPFSNL